MNATIGTETSTTANANRKGDWIQTYTGRQFWPLDPRPEDVCIEDIAHALSNMCRFTGHTKAFYSVAQHSVMVSQIVSPKAALAGLLHDAAEAYMGDIARPWKRFLWIFHGEPGNANEFESLKVAELKLLAVIFNSLIPGAFGIATFEKWIWDEIKQADETMLVTEARDFMAPLVTPWRHSPENGFAILSERISPWNPGAAKYAFLKRFNELTQIDFADSLMKRK